MQSKAKTVEAYLRELPADRRAAIAVLRKVILENLDSDYEEGMQYGMISYYVPHRVYPAGYHCDPTQPLCFAALASQKNYISVYLMPLYAGGEELRRFQQTWKKSGKKLDMGKCCVRVKKLEDVVLDAIGTAIKNTPAQKFIEYCEATVGKRRRTAKKKAATAKDSNKPLKKKKAGRKTARRAMAR